jgi:hypothetical protein
MAYNVNLKLFQTAVSGIFLMVLAQSASAAVKETIMACGFTSECYETQGCSESDLSFQLSVIENGAAPPTEPGGVPLPALGEIVQGSDTQIGEVMRMDTGALMYRANYRLVGQRIRVAPPAMLTIIPNGEARYTAHFLDVALSITYRGRCEIVEDEPETTETPTE